MSAEKPPPLDPELVQEFVLVAHSDLAAVERLLEQSPVLLNSAWDWGGGDWEVRAMLAAHPQLRDAAGPHGIPLVKHAEAGGERAREVLELLEREEAKV